MHTLLVLAVAVGIATADVGLGYNYKVPQTSYGVPTYQGSSGSSSFNNGYYSGLNSNQGQLLGSSLNVPSYPSGSGFESFGSSGTGFDSSSFGSSLESNFGSSGLSSSGFDSSFGTGGLGSGYFETSTLQPTYSVGGSSQFQSSNQFQSSAVNKYQQNYQYVTQPAQVFKHYYVHAAPEEPELPKPKQPIVLPPPQKHYKIIFIKAPSQSYAAPVIPVQQQNEEKTIVYVLVKKPEDAQNIVLPKFEPKPPSKPEVYFIKYNNKEGSQAVINNIVNDYNKGGATVNYNAGEQQAIVTGGLNIGSTLAPSTIAGISGSSLSGFDSGSLSGSSYGVTGSPLVSVSTIDNGSSVGEYDGGSTASSSSSALTGGYSESSTLSSLNFDNSNLISTSQGVPHESYGPPKFRS